MAPGTLQLGPGEERHPSEGLRRVKDKTIRCEELHVALASLDEPSPVVLPEHRLRLAHERGEILGALLQLTIESEREVRGQAEIEKKACAGEHDGHRERERDRDAKPDR
jgi:hypothetical protein